MNKIRCFHCNAVIESTHRHDFKWCSCPSDSSTRVAVDGGPVYTKRAFSPNSVWYEFDQDGNEESTPCRFGQGSQGPEES